MKSNKAVHEEIARQGRALAQEPTVRCPDSTCDNHQPGEIKGRFRRFGLTTAGAPRFRCRLCRKTFSLPAPTARQRRTSVNAEVFRLLVNKVSLSRMMELTDLSASSLYGKIDFIYRQCVRFAASRQARLPEMPFRKLYLSTDRQDYIVNWRTKRARRTIQLTGIGTCDHFSRYVFGLQINFAVDTAAEQGLDHTKPAHLQMGRFETETMTHA